MANVFNASLDMRTYFDSLPKSVQSAIVHSDANTNNLEQLKRLVEGYTRDFMQPRENKTVSSPQGLYEKKYRLEKAISNKYGVSISNPTVQPDARTEQGAPVPDTQNVEYSKEYQEENRL